MHFRVSIIINNYNYAHFLARAIESALAQTYENTEIIVVDDGSTDGSADVVRRYHDQVIGIRKPNGGQASAFNTGFAVSRGAIILFLDADDILEPDAAKKLVEVWHPGLAKAQFPLQAVDAAENSLGYLLPRDRACPGREIELLRSYGYYPSPPSTGNAYSRTALDRLLPMPETSWRLNADTYLIALAPFLGEVAYINEPLARYRIHGTNGYIHRLDLATLRRGLLCEIERERQVGLWAERIGSPIRHRLSARIPGHCKARLISLRLDSDGHPFAEDTVFSILRAAWAAAWTFPHLTRRKRAVCLFVFPVLAVAPGFLLQRSIVPLFVPAARQMAIQWFRRWVRRIRRVFAQSVRGAPV
jgi:glycosyltransferase involved in cell wall biosynthesis